MLQIEHCFKVHWNHLFITGATSFHFPALNIFLAINELYWYICMQYNMNIGKEWWNKQMCQPLLSLTHLQLSFSLQLHLMYYHHWTTVKLGRGQLQPFTVFSWFYFLIKVYFPMILIFSKMIVIFLKFPQSGLSFIFAFGEFVFYFSASKV